MLFTPCFILTFWAVLYIHVDTPFYNKPLVPSLKCIVIVHHACISYFVNILYSDCQRKGCIRDGDRQLGHYSIYRYCTYKTFHKSTYFSSFSCDFAVFIVIWWFLPVFQNYTKKTNFLEAVAPEIYNENKNVPIKLCFTCFSCKD